MGRRTEEKRGAIVSEPAYILTDDAQDATVYGSHSDLTERYYRHVAAIEHSSGNLHAWHVLAARGLYRVLADIECDGGPSAPMGMPHVLCISDEEARSMIHPVRV